ncbi:hypothetical protein AB0A81_41425, partial [Streptomyces flaveolus]|uniref:hypothetical protein n=1 Tax=Streptomyces flaveolus TaxID=67297 RepID=UPI00340A87F0
MTRPGGAVAGWQWAARIRATGTMPSDRQPVTDATSRRPLYRCRSTARHVGGVREGVWSTGVGAAE